MNRWPPDPMSVDYEGPYPVWEIRQARKVLIRCLEDCKNQSLQYVLPKIGIDLQKGCVIPSPLLPIIRNPSIRFANGHPSPNFLARAPSPLFTPRCILPFMGSPAKRPRLYTPQTLENQHFLRHEEERLNFPEADQPVIFNSPTKNFPYRPLLPTPVDVSFEGRIWNGFEEPKDNFSNYYHSSATESKNGLVSFGDHNCLGRDNDTSVERDDKISTPGSFKHEGCGGSPVDVQKMIDVDISSDTLRQILAMVGKIKPINAGQELDCATAQQESEQNVFPQTELNVTLECDTMTAHNSKNQSFEQDISTKPYSMKMYSGDANSESNLELQKSKDIITQQDIDTTEIEVSAENIEQSKVSDVFKCDYCQRSTQSVDQMQNHLSSSKHLTASKYLGTFNQRGHLEPLHIEQILAVTNPKQASSSGHVIACPNCRTVFSDVFTCSQHNKYEHGSTEGYYTICPVIHSELLTLEHHPECPKCNRRFTSWTELNEHWISNRNHSPLTPLLSHQVFHLFECSLCRKSFTENISDAAKHVASHSENCMLSIDVKQVMLPTKREKLLDFNPSLHSNGIRDEMSILQQLCSSNSLTAGLKAASARLKELETRFQFH